LQAVTCSTKPGVGRCTQRSAPRPGPRGR
jgi:hypothetical protein